MPRRIEIVEVGPRDGLQSEPDVLATPLKLELISRLVDAGVRRVEVASFVNPKRVPQMADAEAVMAGLPKRPDVQYVGLVLNRRGFDIRIRCRFQSHRSSNVTGPHMSVYRSHSPITMS